MNANRSRLSGALLRPLSVTSLLSVLFALLWLAAGPALAQGSNPPVVPDGDAGLTLFGERCANCHGPFGAGDGELTGDLPVQPAALNQADFARRQVPAAVFETITNGIAMSGMPPFGPASSNPLSEEDRWHLVAAVLSLGVPSSVLSQGESFYEASCAECHAEGGSASVDMAAQDYWTSRSDADVFAALRDTSAIPEHASYELEDGELWAAIAFARTFSYDHADPLAAFAPIETVSVTGSVRNESTGEQLAGGTPVVLNTFTADFAPSSTMTTTIDANGQYAFELTMAPPDLIYVVTVTYEGINYGSDFGRLERDAPVLNLPVLVFDPTSDPTGVSISQLHIILEFGDGTVNVNELYQFSQAASAVFVGESGQVGSGTVEVALPEGATAPSFSRTFGSIDSFFPVENMQQTARGWADTVPVRPGRGTLSVLASYTLPYNGSATIAHPVFYRVERANVVLAANGVTLSGDDGWTEEAGGAMGGVFPSFTRSTVNAGDTLSFTLSGDPVAIAMPGGDSSTATTAPAARNRTTELVIGGGALLLALAGGLFVLRSWQQRQPGAEVAEAAGYENLDREALLEEIAALDDAFEVGEIDEPTYQRERAALKEALLAVWE
jgi:mono/diheme cytochrome c family protein